MNGIVINAIFAASASFLAVALFIDTTSWWVRSLAGRNELGLFISRSNIYLYGGRFFSLAFVIVISFAIERGLTPKQVALCCFLTFVLSILLHMLCATKGFHNSLIMRILTRALFLPHKSDKNVEHIAYRFDAKLFYSTIFATVIFSVGSGLPLLLASIFIEYRLSMANIGQLINSFGTIAILFFVDQLLFRSLDSGLIRSDIKTYTYGRICGFGTAAACYAVIFLAI
jgi:hypothetical protein